MGKEELLVTFCWLTDQQDAEFCLGTYHDDAPVIWLEMKTLVSRLTNLYLRTEHPP